MVAWGGDEKGNSLKSGAQSLEFQKAFFSRNSRAAESLSKGMRWCGFFLLGSRG